MAQSICRFSFYIPQRLGDFHNFGRLLSTSVTSYSRLFIMRKHPSMQPIILGDFCSLCSQLSQFLVVNAGRQKMVIYQRCIEPLCSLSIDHQLTETNNWTNQLTCISLKEARQGKVFFDNLPVKFRSAG